MAFNELDLNFPINLDDVGNYQASILLSTDSVKIKSITDSEGYLVIPNDAILESVHDKAKQFRDLLEK